VVLLFLISIKNLPILILYSECIWVILYGCVVVVGTVNDDAILASTAFFFLALAGLEFCIGFVITIFFKFLKKSLDLNLQKNYNNQNSKNVTINKCIWQQDYVT
jgi:hypothetical protein